MFYSLDILSRRREGLGIVWLAATLGDRNAVRKLTRRDILTVNVTRICRAVANPPEPFSLRLSSQLMFGVVRIYVQQTDMWMQDVSNAHSSIRKAIAAIPYAPGKPAGAIPALDMTVTQARPDAITMAADTRFFVLDLDPTFLIDYPDPFAARAVTPTGIADGFMPVTPPRYVAPEERITLPRPVYEEAPEEPGVPRVGVPRRPEEEIGFPPFPPEEEVPFDLGLELGEEPEEFPEEAMPPLVEPAPALPEGVPPPEAAVAPVPAPPEPVAPAVVPLARPRKVRILEDRVLELTDEELRASRRDYEIQMEMQRLELQLRERDRQQERAAHQMVFGPPRELLAAPELRDVWSATIGHNLGAVDARFRAARRDALAAAAAAAAAAAPARVSPPVPPSPGVPLGLEGIEMPSDITLEEVARALTPTTLARREAELPWQVLAERRREESLLGLPPGMETISDIAAREFSIETPAGLRRPRRVTPVRRETPVTLPSPLAPSVEGFELGPPPSPLARLPRAPPPPAVGPPAEEAEPIPAQIFEEDLDEETSNFYEYAKAVRDELEDPFLFFSDLAPVASSSPTVAAQAFYHVLALTQARRLKVKQEIAYGEIEIRIVE